MLTSAVRAIDTNEYITANLRAVFEECSYTVGILFVALEFPVPLYFDASREVLANSLAVGKNEVARTWSFPAPFDSLFACLPVENGSCVDDASVSDATCFGEIAETGTELRANDGKTSVIVNMEIQYWRIAQCSR